MRLIIEVSPFLRLHGRNDHPGIILELSNYEKEFREFLLFLMFSLCGVIFSDSFINPYSSANRPPQLSHQ